MACGRSTKWSGCCMGCGAVCVVIGAVMAVFWPVIFFNQLKNMMVLTNESMSFEMWRETPIPMYLECFMWNISNVNEILASDGAVKPELVQMGPYVYKELHTKENVTWNDNNTVTFYNQRYWHFDAERSNGSLTDKVTSINPIVVTVAYYLRFSSGRINRIVNTFLRLFHEHIFLTATVTEWLFDGIDDPVLKIANAIPALGITIPYDKFGWFYERNGSMTYDGVFLMNTGGKDFSQLGNLEKWRYSNRTQYRDECGEVRGSTGELWAPELGQPEMVVFAPDICTFISLHKNESHVVAGIDGMRYSANTSVFDNGHNYPSMACYCDARHPAQCVPAGALNVSACRFGAPAFVSFPHFYGADPAYRAAVGGLAPAPEHQFRMTLEMFTGIPLAVAAQLQINFLVRHVSNITILNKVADDTMMPMFWFRQELAITPEFARMAKFALNLRAGVAYALYALTALGLVLLLTGIVVLIRRILKSPDNEPILQEETSE